MQKLNKLPVILRSENSSRHRCPACAGHLRALGTFNPKDNTKTIHGYICQNHKCAKKVLEKYELRGVPTFRDHPKPSALHLKRATAMMKHHEERVEQANVVISPTDKSITLDQGEGD